MLRRVDGDALDAAIGDWLTARADASRASDQDEHPPSRQVRVAVAVGGTSLRGDGIVLPLLTQTDHAKFLVEEKNVHYLAVLKANHPALHTLVKDLPWREMPLTDHTRTAAHGRDEIRRLKAVTEAGLPFPTPARPCRSSADGTQYAPGWCRWSASTRSPACPLTRRPPLTWRNTYAGTGPSRIVSTMSGMRRSGRTPRGCGPAVRRG
ncbi:hypothetical protein AB0L68_37715 [Streptomyces sp. NPDC052164]|uniref:hypothetical protein n=1 Tax=Streptomyces sp. NPDC052164 TaxID=3155529 RepID=UPI003444F9A4